MHVGNLCRFGNSGINDDEQFVGIFGDPLELPWSLGNLMALHAVPADSQKEICFRNIRIQMNVLAAQGLTAYPEGAGKFLGQGAVMVLGAKSTE